MLEHVEQRYEVIGVALELREVGQPRILDLAAESLAGERPRRPVELARLDLSKSAEHREVVPGATADFEQARFLRRADGAFDQPVEDAAAREEPPMLLVQLGHPVEHRAFHATSAPFAFRAYPSRQEVKGS